MEEQGSHDQLNVLRELAWIPVKRSPHNPASFITPETALLGYLQPDGSRIPVRAGEILTGPGYSVGTVLRFLLSIAAVAERYRSDEVRRPKCDPAAVERALDVLAPYSNLYDTEYPFMQRPLVASQDKALNKVLPTDLDLTVPTDVAKQFWNLRTFPTRLSPAEAALSLAIFHFYGGSNNRYYDGLKMRNGAPGLVRCSPVVQIRGADPKAVAISITPEQITGILSSNYQQENHGTEVFKLFEDLYQTLLSNLPALWTDGEVLPAWAHREATIDTGSSQLWQQTWSPNTTACRWAEDGYLVRARTCGVPLEWCLPTQRPLEKDSSGKAPKERNLPLNQWVQRRNEDSPFILKRRDSEDKVHFKSIAFGPSPTELAVTWIAEGNARALRDHFNHQNHMYSREPDRLLFLSHVVKSDITVLMYLSSTFHVEGTETWAPDPESEEALYAAAEALLAMYNIVECQVNPAHVGSPGKPTGTGKNRDHELPFAGTISASFKTYFWQKISPSFLSYASSPKDVDRREQLFRSVVDIALDAYQEAARPLLPRHLPLVTAAESRISRSLRWHLNRYLEHTP